MFVNLRQNIDNMISIEKLTEKQIESKSIESWPIWEKKVSSFPWQYEADEYCLIIEGEIIVIANNKEYLVKADDFVKFPKGLKCHWNITKNIRKYYQFV